MFFCSYDIFLFIEFFLFMRDAGTSRKLCLRLGSSTKKENLYLLLKGIGILGLFWFDYVRPFI